MFSKSLTLCVQRINKGQISKLRVSSYSTIYGVTYTNYLGLVHNHTKIYQMPQLNILKYYGSNASIKNEEPKSKESAQEEPIVISTNTSRKEKLKKAVKEYGATVIVFHVGISLMSLGSCYALVSMGLDVDAIYQFFGISEWTANSKIVSNAGTFAVAYGIHKVFAPVRIAITLGSVPFLVRYLRKIGFLKK